MSEINSKTRIKGMLAGEEIEIYCTRTQALVLRGRLGEYFEEYETTEDCEDSGCACSSGCC